MGGKAIVGEGLEIRKHPDRQPGAGEECDLFAQLLGVARTLGNDDQRARRLHRRFRQDQGGGGPV